MSSTSIQQSTQVHHGVPAVLAALHLDGMAQPVGEGPRPVPSSRGFTALLDAFRASGGTTSGADLGQLLERHDRGNFVSFARLLVAGELFAFEWRHTLWIPMFQFDAHDLATRRDAQLVRAALPARLSGWSLAAWFAQPNADLDARRPADVLSLDADAVVHAAHAARRPG